LANNLGQTGQMEAKAVRIWKELLVKMTIHHRDYSCRLAVIRIKAPGMPCGTSAVIMQAGIK
jgi:hypothetical protein